MPCLVFAHLSRVHEKQIFDHGLSAAELEGSGGGGTSMGSGNGAGGMREELGACVWGAFPFSHRNRDVM